MKKVLGLMAIGLLLFGLAGQGLASQIPYGDLLQVVYEDSSFGSTEVVTDLGHIGTTLNLSKTYSNLGTAINLGDSMWGGASWSNLHVAYFAINVNSAYISGSTGTADNLKANKINALNNAYNPFASYYYGLMGGGSAGIGSTTNTSSYWKTFDLNNSKAAGLFAQTLKAASGSEVALTGDAILQALYYWSGNAGGNGVKDALIQTNANGTTSINPVPVPATMYLLVPGFLGLIGLRKKALP